MATPIQTEGENAPGSPIPRGTRCLECHYSLNGINMGPCPECGFVMGEAEIHRWQRRARWMDSFLLSNWYVSCFMIPIVYAFGALMLSGRIGTGIVALVMLSITIGGTILTSEILGSLGRRHDRAIARRLWIRYAYLIHLPWLVTAGLAVISLATALVDKRIGSNGMVTEIVSYILWFICAVVSLFSMIELCGIVLSRNHRLALRWSKLQSTIITLVITFQFIYNVILGISGGAIAYSGAIRLAGLSP